jgi:hypothetical protein
MASESWRNYPTCAVMRPYMRSRFATDFEEEDAQLVEQLEKISVLSCDRSARCKNRFCT